MNVVIYARTAVTVSQVQQFVTDCERKDRQERARAGRKGQR